MCEFCSGYSVDMHVRGGSGVTARAATDTTPVNGALGQDYYISAMLNTNNGNFLSWDGAWNSTPRAGAAVNVTYRFNFENVERYGNGTVNAAEVASAKAAIAMYSSYANITFTETTNGAADIGFSKGSLGGSGSSFVSGITHTARYDNGHIAYSDVYVSDRGTDYQSGGSGNATMMHEIGHALGLKHPGNYNSATATAVGPFLPGAEDNNDLSIMSYNDGAETRGTLEPSSAMLFDIAAVQYLYGANHNYNAGNDVYQFSGAQKIWTLWDGNGTDTLDASRISGNHRIDLREGKDTYSAVGQERLWVAFGANIENAIGGTGRDVIHGNNLLNLLQGNTGDDQLFGYNGADTLEGGIGRDTLSGGRGADVLIGGAGGDTLIGGAGGDTLIGGFGADRFVVQSVADSARGQGDVIQDFRQNEGDTLDFSALSGTLNFIGTSTFSGAANEVRYSISGGNTLVSVNTNADKIADMEVTLLGVVNLTSGDLVL